MVLGMGEGGVDGVVGVERIYSLLLIIFPEDLANAEPSIIVGALYVVLPVMNAKWKQARKINRRLLLST